MSEGLKSDSGVVAFHIPKRTVCITRSIFREYVNELASVNLIFVFVRLAVVHTVVDLVRLRNQTLRNAGFNRLTLVDKRLVPNFASALLRGFQKLDQGRNPVKANGCVVRSSRIGVLSRA